MESAIESEALPENRRASRSKPFSVSFATGGSGEAGGDGTGGNGGGEGGAQASVDQSYVHAHVLAESESSISRLLQSLSEVVLTNMLSILVTRETSKASGWLNASTL